MARYHTVYSRLWSSRDFRSWTEDGRHLALYLLTCPARTTEGLFRLPIPLAAHELQWPTDRVERAVAELEGAEFIAIDRDADLVWLVNAVRWNTPRGPKQIKGAVNALADVPSSPLRAPYLDRCRSVSPALADAISTDLKWQPYPIEGVSEGLPNPSDCSSSFSFSNTTPPTPPSPDTQADPDSAGLAGGQGVDIWGRTRQAPTQLEVPPSMTDPDSVADPDSARSPAVVRLADRLVQSATVDPSALADDEERQLVAEAVAAGVAESAMLRIAGDATTKARTPRPYLRAGIERLTAEAGTRPAAVGPNPLANIADDVPVPPLPAPETTAAGLAAARAQLKRAPA